MAARSMAELGEQFLQRLVRAGGDCVEGGEGVDHSRVVLGEYIDTGGGEFVGVGQALVSEWVVVRDADHGGGESTEVGGADRGDVGRTEQLWSVAEVVPGPGDECGRGGA